MSWRREPFTYAASSNLLLGNGRAARQVASSNLLLVRQSSILLMRELPTSLCHILARNLLILKDQHGWSEAAISKKSGVAQKTINNILNSRHNPTLLAVERLAAAFRVTPWRLLDPSFAPVLPPADEWEVLQETLSSLTGDQCRQAVSDLLGRTDDEVSRQILAELVKSNFSGQ